MDDMQLLIERTDAAIKKVNLEGNLGIVDSTPTDFQRHVQEIKEPYEEIAKYFQEAIGLSKHDTIHLWLIAALLHPSPRYVPSLCSMLTQKDGDASKETIVEVLDEIRSPLAIGCLAEACSFLSPNDIFHELPVKSLEALAAINTPDAWEAIAHQSYSKSERVRERVERLLKWHEKHPFGEV